MSAWLLTYRANGSVSGLSNPQSRWSRTAVLPWPIGMSIHSELSFELDLRNPTRFLKVSFEVSKSAEGMFHLMELKGNDKTKGNRPRRTSRLSN